eukprot:853746-Rhodomonas_salina.1
MVWYEPRYHPTLSPYGFSVALRYPPTLFSVNSATRLCDKLWLCYPSTRSTLTPLSPYLLSFVPVRSTPLSPSAVNFAISLHAHQAMPGTNLRVYRGTSGTWGS